MKFVLLKTKNQKRFVPVEVHNLEIPDDDEVYDQKRHTSHLRNCEKRATDWNEVMLVIFNQQMR
ncbi:MAG: hypothetical protein KF721_09905 [Ignavibacteriaceae bacterium]|nr:hypothetical protein [Ignavibacteriaceae bacterium]